ncbi:hypothetical protein SAMD00023353_2200570 [Rosellinia necatrix]|uniref:DUF7708 domain-containing protein n=1 Tax=Rosellinia necatrix TaxID=77044 RepID=A0A1S7UNV8_ROSNE|nr:hypothetical protein SAMD00023353_2200570 [Rosellinia necatrix]
MLSLQEWYAPAKQNGNNSQLSIAALAFHEARLKFLSGNNHHREIFNSINSQSGPEDVLAIVAECMKKYEARRKSPTARTWLREFSQRVNFYGNILDVLVQHHPEYVSLAWGAMKFLFVGVINHEKTVERLAEALSKIADMLPHIQLSSALYPTEHMRTAIAELYANIMRFFIRAYDWYEEGTLKHMLHSITRPVELRYQDLLQRIEQCSLRIHTLASVGQQAEIRDLHTGLHARLDDMNLSINQQFDKLSTRMEEIGNAMTLQSAAMINTNHVLTDIQFSQIMRSLARLPMWDAAKTFQYHRSLRDRRTHNAHRGLSARFWDSPKLARWFGAAGSEALVVAGTFQSRFCVRNFCVDVIEQLRSAGIPVLFALKVGQEMSDGGSSSAPLSSTDVLKYLLRQALQETKGRQTEKSMSLSCARVESAMAEEEWFQTLEAALSAFEQRVYLVIDLEILDRELRGAGGFHWLSSFLSLFEKLLDRCATTRIKVLLIGYGHEFPFPLSTDEQSKFVIQARTDVVTVRQQKLRRHTPQRGIPNHLKGSIC